MVLTGLPEIQTRSAFLVVSTASSLPSHQAVFSCIYLALRMSLQAEGHTCTSLKVGKSKWLVRGQEMLPMREQTDGEGFRIASQHSGDSSELFRLLPSRIDL